MAFSGEAGNDSHHENASIKPWILASDSIRKQTGSSAGIVAPATALATLFRQQRPERRAGTAHATAKAAGNFAHDGIRAGASVGNHQNGRS
jgi:hypothetical protein